MTTTPEALFEQAQAEERTIRDLAVQAVEYFIDREDEVFTFEEAAKVMAEELEIETPLAASVISHLASDDVDPLIMVGANGQRHVTVTDYAEGDWWYGYEDFDPVKGRGRKVVCSQCVKEESHPSAVGKVFSPDIGNPNANHNRLRGWLMERHFENRHPDVDPEKVGVHIGASLATGTTIASNTAIHTGNESQLSFFDGTDLTADVNNSAVVTDEADITNETYIEATRSSDASGISTGTWTNIADGEDKDVRNEFNSSQQFVPDATAEYTVNAYARMEPGSDQDRLQIRVRNITDSTTLIGSLEFSASGTGDEGVIIPGLSGTFSAGDKYEIQVVAIGGSFGIDATATRAVIKKTYPHP